jgi:hypothetical protein
LHGRADFRTLTPTMQLSQQFKQALWESRVRDRQPMYRFAVDAGMTASALSAMLHGARPVKSDDQRIIKIGKRLGLNAADCFVDDTKAVTR